MPNLRPAILAYHFPQWHRDPRNDRWHGPGWTEWELLRANPPRFSGHRPLAPAWGEWDESDPAMMAREIDAAADAGIDAFLFDVYYYEDGPFLDRAITRGYLAAPNNRRVQMAVMWANHTWRNWHPCKAAQHPWRDEPLVAGAVSRGAFDRFVDIVADWMSRPTYFRIDGRPYFSFYEVRTFVGGMGGVDEAAFALDHFRDVVRKRAGTEPHIGCVCNRLGVAPEEAAGLVRRLGLTSITPYNALDHAAAELDFPVGDFATMHADNRRAWTPRDAVTGLAYIPNVTTGWDSSPRAVATDAWQRRMYPWMPVVMPTEAQWRAALGDLVAWFSEHPEALPVATINAWNEWTEGAVLLPDAARGSMLLDTFREVFGGK